MPNLWWQEGPIYQIYPRSFLDSNGDGVGDLEGIRRKLDYLADLGAAGIWLSPIYPSPMFDFGYDISCYRDIDPLFGTLDGFARLVREAEQRGIRIIMDMVLNHTSHRHSWFEDSRSGKESGKRDWYLWREPRRGLLGSRRPPNNWMAAFGGRAWTYDKKSGQYYLHLFTEQQPDLNWRNGAVKAAMFDELRFWLDLGVKGFRLDVINYLVKDAAFRNNPYRLRATYPRRHDLQHHAYDRNQAETLDIIRELRTLADGYGDAMLVGEVYPDEGVHSPDLAGAYLGDGTDLLHLAFDFSPVYTPLRASAFRSILEDWYGRIPEKGHACHVLSNHDQSRALSRYLRGLGSRGAEYENDVAKCLAALLLTQKGTPFLYYGEEIGMRDGRIGRRDLQDPLGKKYYPLHPGRDRSRTPMQWDSTDGAGFSSGKPWLPINGDYRERNVAAQSADGASILSWYRSLIRLRKDSPALREGTIEFLGGGDSDILHYRRTAAGESVGVILNLAPKAAIAHLPEGASVLLSGGRRTGSGFGGKIVLSAYESTLYALEGGGDRNYTQS